MLGNLFEFKAKEQKLEFGELRRVDQMILIVLAQHLQRQRQGMDSALDVKTYTEEMKKFTHEYVAAFYLELLKDRMLFNKGTPGFQSAQSTLLSVLTSLLVEAGPILAHTCQEVF